MSTEDVDPRLTDLDAWPLSAALEAMWDGQMSAVAAVRAALPAITTATQAASEALGATGRLIYVGAGTSGRIGVQDGAELTPTFNWPWNRTVFIIAGGNGALIKSVEGAEDNADDAVRQIEAAAPGAADVVICIAASGSTPFTVAAIRRSTKRGAVSIGIANNANTPLLSAARFPILLETGSEPVAGSTRMKAGTVQKVALNLISTGIMLRLGRVYGGMMVNMQVSNAKLTIRAQQMVARITQCDTHAAARALDVSGGDIKLAALIAFGHRKADAIAMLTRANGNLRLAISGRDNGAS